MRHISTPDTGTVFLEQNGWDDYHFQTLFTLRYRDQNGTLRAIGSVKIGQFDLGDSGRPELPDEFERLGTNQFSLGQDDSYYHELNGLGDEIRNDILESLNDVALNLDLFDLALAESVTGKSL